ncbi:MAG: hypothetical protein L0H10_18170 [Comamonas sp.]|nr:hypothetical protein [Comamonas sp.]
MDESEHSGAPDIITIRARAADLSGEIRKRTEKSWHDSNLGAILATLATLATLAKRNKLTYKVNAKLGATQVQHIDQTNESDMQFITRLARKYDVVATVKQKHLLFTPINGTKTSKDESLPHSSRSPVSMAISTAGPAAPAMPMTAWRRFGMTESLASARK